jgi:SAM-dependent methyltransferase
MSIFDDPGLFGRLWAEHYDVGPELDPLPAVDFLAGLAAGGPVLELAIGTGRVALPFAARGFAVEGVEASEEMVAKMRAKPGGEEIPVAIGDMADVPVSGPYTLVYLVYNTLFNLVREDRQRDCLRNVARVLAPGGAFVVETFVPDPADFDRDEQVQVREVTEESATIRLHRYDRVRPGGADVRPSDHHVRPRGRTPVALRHAVSLAGADRRAGRGGRPAVGRTLRRLAPPAVRRDKQGTHLDIPPYRRLARSAGGPVSHALRRPSGSAPGNWCRRRSSSGPAAGRPAHPTTDGYMRAIDASYVEANAVRRRRRCDGTCCPSGRSRRFAGTGRIRPATPRVPPAPRCA